MSFSCYQFLAVIFLLSIICASKLYVVGLQQMTASIKVQLVMKHLKLCLCLYMKHFIMCVCRFLYEMSPDFCRNVD